MKPTVGKRVVTPRGELGVITKVFKVRVAVRVATLFGFKEVLYHPQDLRYRRTK